MMTSANVAERRSNFEPLIDIGMGVDVFAADWLYCDRLSSYISRMVSHDRTDSLLYANLFSSALNELLETAFRRHGETGRLVCRVLRDGACDRIELEIPCDSEATRFFDAAAAQLRSDTAAEHYREALFADGPLDPGIGLLELKVDYAAEISVTPLSENVVLLAAQLTLEPDTIDA